MSLTATKTTHLAIRIPVDLAAALRERARVEDRTVSNVVRRAITASLAEDQIGSDVRIRSGGGTYPFEDR